MQKMRPKHLALWQIYLPIPAIVSILNRASGALLFMALPFLLYLLQRSLSSAAAFHRYCTIMAHPLTKLILLAFLWSFFQHLLAGIRFLLLDFHIGIEIDKARLSAKIVFFLALLLTFMVGILIW